MAHTAKVTAKLEIFLITIASADLRSIAQAHLALGEELLETDDHASARATRALIAAVDAIGAVKFPREWKEARDNAGHDQAA